MGDLARENRLFTLSADVFQDHDDTWTASLSAHPQGGGPGVMLWRKTGMRSGHNADTAMEAAYQRIMKACDDDAA